MVRVRPQLEEAVSDETIDRGVHALPGDAHPPGDLGDRERPGGQCDGPEDLPARRCQPLAGTEAVSCVQQPAVSAERRQDDSRRRLPDTRSAVRHVSGA
jgi:hypothetical protein